jgi:hypothetical protein
MYTEILSNTNRESIQVLWTNRQFGKIPKKELHRNTEHHEPVRAFRCSGRQFGKIPKKELHRNTERHEPGKHSGALDELREYTGAQDE